MGRAAELARTAAEEAGRRVEGRPLAAGHADVPWPSAPHLVLWHAQSILREYRGDGHIAQLVVHGLSGIESLVTHAAAGDVPAHLLRSTRAWPERPGTRRGRRCAAAAGSNRATTSASPRRGAAQRQAIEDGTDVLAAAPYAVLGEDRCAELRALARPWSTTFAQQLR